MTPLTLAFLYVLSAVVFLGGVYLIGGPGPMLVALGLIVGAVAWSLDGALQ